jgi:glutathione synthase/RimK-type ligase-like ATP-grasp enzyme
MRSGSSCSEALSIALVTCRTLPEPDHDEAPLLAALADLGQRAALVAWDDPAARLDPFDLAVLRSTWNYHEQPRAFRAWIDAAERATRVINAPSVLRWNMHKGYLRELAARGIQIVPTEFTSVADTSFAAVLDVRGWDDVVVKPAVSAASARTRRFRRDEAVAGQQFLADNVRLGDMMIQRYQRSVATHGERNLIWIDGELTHCIRKEPRFAGGSEAVTAVAIDDRDRVFAERVLRAAPPGIAYARIDLMHGDDGEPLLSELELIEPSLHFPLCPAALRRFAAMLPC